MKNIQKNVVIALMISCISTISAASWAPNSARSSLIQDAPPFYDAISVQPMPAHTIQERESRSRCVTCLLSSLCIRYKTQANGDDTCVWPACNCGCGCCACLVWNACDSEQIWRTLFKCGNGTFDKKKCCEVFCLDWQQER